MNITSLLLVSLIMGVERIFIRGQDYNNGEGGNGCCVSMAVSVGGVFYANLAGDYQLKEDKGSKPHDVCVNGCIYTKVGSPCRSIWLVWKHC